MGVFRFDAVPMALGIVLMSAIVPAIADEATAWNWRLAGVIVGPGVARALFARDGETQSVVAGRQIDGWTLTAIRPDGVTLDSPAGERVLHPEASAAGADAVVRQPSPAAPTVATAARVQRQDQAAAEAVLSDATRQMMQAGGATDR